MVLTETPICDFGWKPNDFKLLNIDGNYFSLSDLQGENGLVIVFACNHCPYVIAIQDTLIKDAQTLEEMGINLALINSNDAIKYPDDSYEKMQLTAQQKNYPFPYLYDETQQVAKSWGAVCTPDFFGFNQNLELQYRGRLDSSGKIGDPNSRRDLVLAMQEMIETGKGPVEQIPSMGCSIKWK
jgi:peroxiredoxin